MRNVKFLFCIFLLLSVESLFALSFSEESANATNIKKLNSVGGDNAAIIEVKSEMSDFSFNFITAKGPSLVGVQIFKDKELLQEMSLSSSTGGFAAINGDHVELMCMYPEHYKDALKEQLYTFFHLTQGSDGLITGFNFLSNTEDGKFKYSSEFSRGLNSDVYSSYDIYDSADLVNRNKIESNHKKIPAKKSFTKADTSTLDKRVFESTSSLVYENHTNNAQEVGIFDVSQPSKDELWLYYGFSALTFCLKEESGIINLYIFNNEELYAQSICNDDFIFNEFSYKTESDLSGIVKMGYSLTSSQYDIFIDEHNSKTKKNFQYGYKFNMKENSINASNE